MRQLKFKVWDNGIEKFIEDRQKDKLVKRSFFWNTRDVVMLLNEQFIFLQFTGLKDKNCVEIYEGDIVRFGWQGNEVGIVKFEHGGYYVKTKTSRSYFMHPDAYEVVGNMYSDPELLEGIE